MKTIKEVLYECQANKTAVLATNFYNYETLLCVAKAAQAMNAPVMLQLTRSSIDYMGLHTAYKMGRQVLEDYGLQGYIHLDHGPSLELVQRCLDEGFESAMTVMTLPEHLLRFYRTSNNIERINKELKRRSKVIGVFPNAESLLRLMGSVLIELHGSMASGKAVFSKETLATIMTSDIPENLISIAKEQHQLRAA